MAHTTIKGRRPGVQLDVATYMTFIGIDVVRTDKYTGKVDRTATNIDNAQAHELADWIKANVSQPLEQAKPKDDPKAAAAARYWDTVHRDFTNNPWDRTTKSYTEEQRQFWRNNGIQNGHTTGGVFDNKYPKVVVPAKTFPSQREQFKALDIDQLFTWTNHLTDGRTSQAEGKRSVYRKVAEDRFLWLGSENNRKFYSSFGLYDLATRSNDTVELAPIDG